VDDTSSRDDGGGSDKVRDRLVVSVIIGLAWITRLVPMPIWVALSMVVGLASMLTGKRHVVLANVRHTHYGSPPGFRGWWLGASMIGSHVRTVIHTLRASIDPPDASRFSARGLEHILPHLGQRGIILVAPHAGPYTTLAMMGRRWLADQGFEGELVVVARMFQPLRSDAVMDWFVDTLGKGALTIIPVDEQPQKLAMALQRTLRNNGIVVLLVDEPTPTPSLNVPFFDSTIRMPIGPARLARATRSVVIPVMARYRPFGRQSIEIAPAVVPAADPAVTLGQAARSLEGLLRTNLAQWSMLTPIWSTPGNAKSTSLKQAELHLHTHGSDGLRSIDEWREAARANGVRVIGITDHDHIEVARTWAMTHERDDGEVAVIPGVELTARGRIVHVSVLFPEEVPSRIPKAGTPLPEIVRWAREIPGAIVVLVHPHPILWKRQLRGLAAEGLLPDAMETCYPLVGWQNRTLEHAARRYGIAVLGGSDAHLAGGQLGRHVTRYPGDGIEDLVTAIRTRTTRAATLPGGVTMPGDVHIRQSLASWMLPWRERSGVEPVRQRILEGARLRADGARPVPVGVAEPVEER